MNCIKKALSLTLSLVLAFGAFAGIIMADLGSVRAEDPEADITETDNPGIHLDKTAELQQDGTYTINLSAFSTGKVISQVITKEVPTDIVLVIDQSGSMSGQPLTDLKAALHDFVDEIYEHSVQKDVDHRVAMVGFSYPYSIQTGWIGGAGTYNFRNTEIIIDGREYLYNGGRQTLRPNDNTAAQSHYGEALMHIVDSHTAIERSIDALAAEGPTYAHYGMEMAKGILDKYYENDDYHYYDLNGEKRDRKRVVVFFTDGQPGITGNPDFDDETTIDETISTLNIAKQLKEDGVMMFDVGLFEVDHAAEGSLTWEFMAALSSDYPHATATKHSRLTLLGRRYWIEFDLGEHDGSGAEFFGFVEEHEEGAGYDEHMNNIQYVFESISQSIMNGAPNTQLGGVAILKDIISDNFIIPEGFSVEDNVTARIANCTAIDSAQTGVSAYTFDEENATVLSSATITREGKAIKVSGFDYSEDYCYTANNRTYGKKLEVEIRGLEAKPGIYGEQLLTNDPYLSGIYPNELADKPDPKLIFPKPTVDIPRLVYVYDFGMDMDFNYDTLHDASAVSSIELFDCYSKTRPAPEQFVLSEDGDRIGFGETPSASQLRTIGAFVSRNAGNKTVYEWTRIDILPATTVFYEEGFMSTVDGSFSGGLTASWESVGSADGAMQSYENFDYGYDSAYEGSYGDSLGGAYKVTVSNDMYTAMYGAGGSGSWPMASFSFTGTDVTVLGKVGLKMGMVGIQVLDSEGRAASNVLVDTYSRLELSQTPIFRLSEKLSASYQPTGADTYTVNICPVYLPWLDRTKMLPEDAIAAHEKEIRDMLGWSGDAEIGYYAFGGGERGLRGSGSYDIWIDGFRVYEPFGSEPGAEVVSAYAAASEHPASYLSIRSLINNGVDGVDGVDGSINGSVLYVECWDTPDGDSTVVGSVDIATYVDFGPEFEAYLAPSAEVEAGLAFTVDGWNKDAGSRLYISAKSLDGEAAELTVGGREGTPIEIASGMELFYDITDLVDGATGTVLIRNTGSSRVSLIDMKIIDPSEASMINTSMNTLMCAEAMLYGIMGDADGDGEVSFMDAIVAMRHALGGSQLDAYGSYCADINRDGTIDLTDALYIMHTALNC